MIRTEHLGCGYGRCEVLHDINITMNPGELWCVLGANGVGKSTLFKTLLGLLKPSSRNQFLSGSLGNRTPDFSRTGKCQLSKTRMFKDVVTRF